MAITQSELKGLAQTLSMMIDAIEHGMTPEQVRAGCAAAGVPAKQADTWFEMANALHEAMEPEPRRVTNPRFRKGTAMKPVAWSDCLWQPPA